MDEPNLELAPVAPGQEELTIKQLQYAHGLATGLDYNVAWRRAGLGPYTKKKATTLAKHPEEAMVIKDVVESSNRAIAGEAGLPGFYRALCGGRAV